MGDAVIRVERLGKQYQIGASQARHSDIRERLANSCARLFRPFPGKRHGGIDDSQVETIWALKDISFQVERGEVLGVIGRNGSGKSTLLKILSGITVPTRGEVDINGRVGSLLEVGTGFHPELTGRENIYLNGAILGIRKSEIERKFDEIVEFSEVGKFIDTPVKHYSSGMHVRLAFAVAAHLEPEILLVDEVLAVGDLAFQKKCMGRMSNVAKDGRTVLFVSHNMAAVRKLCSRVIFLEGGNLKSCGEPAEVIMEYIEGVSAGQSICELLPPTDKDAPGRAHTLAVENSNGIPAVAIPVGKPWQIRVHFTITRRTEHFMIALGLRTSEEIVLRTSWSTPCTLEPGFYEAIFREATILLGSDRYTLILGLSTHERTFHYVENAGFLDIAGFAEGTDFVRVSQVGAILNPFDIDIRKVENLTSWKN
jgi:lipopolysaccharide transport system ATP-binding protein